eukprot:m.159144 g.159144  ORF g.159144 m.159144 type:complete len:271 (-) comp9836_c0_seq9:302-1114(-)
MMGVGMLLAEDLRAIDLVFSGELGRCEGPKREYFSLLARELHNPAHQLFRLYEETGNVLPWPWVRDHRAPVPASRPEIMETVGRLVGACIMAEVLFPLPLACTFLQAVLRGPPPALADLGTIDPQLQRNMQWLLDNPVAADLGISASIQVPAAHGLKTIALSADMDPETPITDENKERYVALMVEAHLSRAIAADIDSFRRGFEHEVSGSEPADVRCRRASARLSAQTSCACCFAASSASMLTIGSSTRHTLTAAPMSRSSGGSGRSSAA